MRSRPAKRPARRGEVTSAQTLATSAVSNFYDPDSIIDAPEHEAYSRAMGLLTWGPWDDQPRPFDERLRDFLQAYPPEAPARFQGSMLVKCSDGEYGPASDAHRIERMAAANNSFGTLVEVLARYGLKLRAGPEYIQREIAIAPFREVAQLRNRRLRLLYGAVDVEAENMDDAKSAELERLEKRRAAEQIRAARQRMREEGEATPPSKGETEE